MDHSKPALLIWSSLFPSAGTPQAGIFIRVRMFRLRDRMNLAVMSPQPWFPFQGIIRRWKPHFRPELPAYEVQTGIEIWRPRYLSAPGLGKWLDGLMMSIAAWRRVKALHAAGRVDLIDAHFGYPDGYAATRVARRLKVPCTITLRGTEVRHSADAQLRKWLLKGLASADRVFTVSESLRQLAIGLGLAPERVRTIGNGVDGDLYRPVNRTVAREELGLPADARVLITVGGLVERKGFHRVIRCIPELLKEFPTLQYLMVGSGGPEGDATPLLKSMVQELGLESRVHFVGALREAAVCSALSASDVFVLSTRNEGWANVLLEALACAVPVVASDVGGNAEVICRPDLGTIVPFDDHDALVAAIRSALQREWSRETLRAYADQNSWSSRAQILSKEFELLLQGAGKMPSV